MSFQRLWGKLPRLNAFLAATSKHGRYLLAIVAGSLLGLSFPGFDIAGFAWTAPGLMLLAAMGTRGRDSFRIGYIAGLTSGLISLHWLLFIPVKGFPILGWAALSAFLALYPATWVWLCIRMAGIRFQVLSGVAANAGWLNAAKTLSILSWSRRTLWCLCCAATWVALELVQTRLFGGFPWNLLGASQHRMVPLIQIASVTGIYGVSFLVVWGSVSFLCAGALIACRPHPRSTWIGDVILPFTAVFALFVFGFHRMTASPAPRREIRVTLVQPSIPQTLIWNPDKDEERFHELVRLSDSALEQPADILVWPESAIPKMLRYSGEIFQAVTNLAVKHHVWMIVGSDDAEPARNSTDPKDVEYLQLELPGESARRITGAISEA